MDKFQCSGCGQWLDEPHKMCPAWGTSYYMSGIPLPSGYTKTAIEELRSYQIKDELSDEDKKALINFMMNGPE